MQYLKWPQAVPYSVLMRSVRLLGTDSDAADQLTIRALGLEINNQDIEDVRTSDDKGQPQLTSSASVQGETPDIKRLGRSIYLFATNLCGL